ncbi:MAG: hypothetical protein PGN29_14615 [Gordonia paraffinivorans]
MTTTTPSRTGRAVTVYTALARIIRTLRNETVRDRCPSAPRRRCGYS